MNTDDLIERVPPLSNPSGLFLGFVVVALCDYFTQNIHDFIYSLPYSNHVFDVWVLSAVYIILRAAYFLACFYWLYSVAYYFRNELQQARIKLAGSSCRDRTFLVLLGLSLLVYYFVILPFDYDINLWIAYHEAGVAYPYSTCHLVLEIISCLLWAYLSLSVALAYLLWLSLRVIPLDPVKSTTLADFMEG